MPRAPFLPLVVHVPPLVWDTRLIPKSGNSATVAAAVVVVVVAAAAAAAAAAAVVVVVVVVVVVAAAAVAVVAVVASAVVAATWAAQHLLVAQKQCADAAKTTADCLSAHTHGQDVAQVRIVADDVAAHVAEAYLVLAWGERCAS